MKWAQNFHFSHGRIVFMYLFFWLPEKTKNIYILNSWFSSYMHIFMIVHSKNKN